MQILTDEESIQYHPNEWSREGDHSYWSGTAEQHGGRSAPYSFQPQNWDPGVQAFGTGNFDQYAPKAPPTGDAEDSSWSGYERYEQGYPYAVQQYDPGYNQGWYYSNNQQIGWPPNPYYPQYHHPHHSYASTNPKEASGASYDTTHGQNDEHHPFHAPHPPSAYPILHHATNPASLALSHAGHVPPVEHHSMTDSMAESEKQRQRRNRSKSFPEKLMQCLTETVVEEAVSWLPDGRSFVILNQDLFVEKVLSTVFKATKYASFIRKLHRWGFVRLTSGIGADCFHHPLFTKENPGNAAYITCPTVQSKAASVEAKRMHTKPSLPGVERFIRSKMSALAHSQATSQAAEQTGSRLPPGGERMHAASKPSNTSAADAEESLKLEDSE